MEKNYDRQIKTKITPIESLLDKTTRWNKPALINGRLAFVIAKKVIGEPGKRENSDVEITYFYETIKHKGGFLPYMRLYLSTLSIVIGNIIQN